MKIIAINGPELSGKHLIGKLVAKDLLGSFHLDIGEIIAEDLHMYGRWLNRYEGNQRRRNMILEHFSRGSVRGPLTYNAYAHSQDLETIGRTYAVVSGVYSEEILAQLHMIAGGDRNILMVNLPPSPMSSDIVTGVVDTERLPSIQIEPFHSNSGKVTNVRNLKNIVERIIKST